MKIKLTVLAFFISMLLTGQVLAFDVGGLSYSAINATDVEVTGRASGNTATDIVIPDAVVDSGITYDVTIIGNYAFQSNALTSVIIPDSVTTIGEGAFADNALVSVIIPNSVTTIGDDAFYNNAFTSAAFRGDFGNFNLKMFNSNPTLATITYCDVKAGWPQGFNNSSTIVVTTPISCSPPDAPTIDSVVPGNAQVIIATTPGADNGSPITSYTAFCFGDTLIFGASPTSPITVSGLTNDVSYACAVTAANDVGTSPASGISAPVTPVAPPPGC